MNYFILFHKHFFLSPDMFQQECKVLNRIFLLRASNSQTSVVLFYSIIIQYSSLMPESLIQCVTVPHGDGQTHRHVPGDPRV